MGVRVQLGGDDFRSPPTPTLPVNGDGGPLTCHYERPPDAKQSPSATWRLLRRRFAASRNDGEPPHPGLPTGWDWLPAWLHSSGVEPCGNDEAMGGNDRAAGSSDLFNSQLRTFIKRSSLRGRLQRNIRRDVVNDLQDGGRLFRNERRPFAGSAHQRRIADRVDLTWI